MYDAIVMVYDAIIMMMMIIVIVYDAIIIIRREGRSQAGPKGHRQEVGALRAPKLLV